MSSRTKVMNFVRFLTFSLVCVFPFHAKAWPPTYGPEFTFSNEKLFQEVSTDFFGASNSMRVKFQDRFIEAVTAHCRLTRACVVNGTLVTFPDGWWFRISTDPKVIEIQTKPMTLSELEKLAGRIQTEIFDRAAGLGLRPSGYANGMGHIHIGIDSAFGNDDLAFRNFVVDLANHPELSDGILGRPDVDVTLAEANQKARQAFAEVIESFDHGEVKTISGLSERIQDKVYTLAGRRVRGRRIAFSKYQVINITKAREGGTIELRGIRAQENAEGFVKNARLLEARLAMLKKRGKPIRFWNLDPLHSRQGKVSRFHQYVTEAGLEWNDFKDLMQGSWRAIPPDPHHPAPVADLGSELKGPTRVEKDFPGGACVRRAVRKLMGWIR